MLRRYVGDKAFYKYVLSIALPIMLQNGITNFVNMLDNVMVGQIDTVQMAGVSVANQLIFVFSLSLFGAVSGAGLFGTQFFGKQDNDGLRYTFRFKLMFCLLLATVGIGLFLTFGKDLIMLFLKNDNNATNIALALKSGNNYLNIMLVGLVPFAITQCYSSTLRECGETVLPMKAGITAVIVNLLFNYILIFGKFGAPKLGVIGAAVATVLSRFVEVAIVVVWTHTRKSSFQFMRGIYKSPYVPKSLMASMCAKGAPLMLNETLWSIGLAMVNQRYSTRGIDVVAAMNISQTFWNVFSVAFIATGTAIGIIIGHLLGAGKFNEVKDTTLKLIAFSLGTSIIVGLVFYLFAQFIPAVYNTTPHVREIATGIMTISAIMMPINAFVHASYFTIRSGGKALVTFLFDGFFMCAVVLPVAFILSKYTALSILPLYFCCQSVDFLKAIIGFFLLKKGSWIRNIVGTEITEEQQNSLA